jgi:hypothetical protein
MSKSRKNRKRKPPGIKELLTEKVSDFLAAGNITPMMVYDILLTGHRVYRQGTGLPHEEIWRAIINGFSDHERYYLTPGQHAALYGREIPTEEDFAELSI